jgi:hypothetical protein
MLGAIVSTRRLPGRSGIAIVRSSKILMKPGGSPRGLTSALPSVPTVEMEKHPKRPRDLNQWAKHMVDIATGLHF